MTEEVSCKGFRRDGADRCQYDSVWFCKHPLCRAPTLTSTMPGAYPSGCPILYPWNRKKGVE